MIVTNDTVRLQEIGPHPAKPVADLQVGDVTVWNGGGEAEVIAITNLTRLYLSVRLRYTTDRGKTFQESDRRLKKNRLVACKGLTYVPRPDAYLEGLIIGGLPQ